MEERKILFQTGSSQVVVALLWGRPSGRCGEVFTRPDTVSGRVLSGRRGLGWLHLAGSTIQTICMHVLGERAVCVVSPCRASSATGRHASLGLCGNYRCVCVCVPQCTRMICACMYHYM